MRRHMIRCFVTAVLAAVFSAQAAAAQLLIPVGEVVGLSIRDGSVTVAAFPQAVWSAPAASAANPAGRSGGCRRAFVHSPLQMSACVPPSGW